MGAKGQGADSQTVEGRWQVVPRTLCFVTNGDDILLMKRGAHKRIFPNHYNGLGGHIERGEDPMTSALREIKEETGLDVVNMQYCGSTHIDAGQATGILLYIFKAEATTREVVESDEGTLHWLPLQNVLTRDDLPLVEDLPIVLPMIFRDGAIPFFAHVSYDENDQIVFQLAKKG